jgi:hypothetical protein
VTIATLRNNALPQGETRKTTKSAPAAEETTPIGCQPGAPRTARAIISGASTPVAMINRNEIACTQPCQVVGLSPLSIGTSTRNAAKISCSRTLTLSQVVVDLPGQPGAPPGSRSMAGAVVVEQERVR